MLPQPEFWGVPLMDKIIQLPNFICKNGIFGSEQWGYSGVHKAYRA
jgi:hypothetical protein